MAGGKPTELKLGEPYLSLLWESVLVCLGMQLSMKGSLQRKFRLYVTCQNQYVVGETDYTYANACFTCLDDSIWQLCHWNVADQ